MRVVALIAVLALPLAACGEAPDGSVYTEPVVKKLSQAEINTPYVPPEGVVRVSTRDILVATDTSNSNNLTRSKYESMTAEERLDFFALPETDPRHVLTQEGFGGETRTAAEIFSKQ